MVQLQRRPARALALMLLAALGTLFVASRAGGAVSLPTSSADKAQLPQVHQTWKRTNLPPHMKIWPDTWRHEGFSVTLTDDAGCEADVRRLAKETGDDRFIAAYHKLGTPVRRSDFWRYAKIWLDGGIYADVDIGAVPETARMFSNIKYDDVQLVLFHENSVYDNPIGRFHFNVGVTDWVRVPQVRQSIFYARRRHPVLLATLQAVAEQITVYRNSSSKVLTHHVYTPGVIWTTPPYEPKLTLELTGPGVWTDAVLRWVHAQIAPTSYIMLSTWAGHRAMTYRADGSWRRKPGKRKPGEGEFSVWGSTDQTYKIIGMWAAILCPIILFFSARNRMRARIGLMCGRVTDAPKSVD